MHTATENFNNKMTGKKSNSTEYAINIQGGYRIAWVDVAKGITMLLVIIGHTSVRDSAIWTWCYSFHMPMFFILSGYTANKANSWHDYFKHVKKNFVHLILPCIPLEVLRIIFVFFQSAERSRVVLCNLIVQEPLKVFWASGATNNAGDIPALGSLWFLIALFWGKALWEAIEVLFPKENFIISIFIAYIGVVLGQQHYLPQELDVVMVVVFFLSFGKELRKISQETHYEKNKNIIATVGFCIWMICLSKGIRIELAWRAYPYGVVALVESCCATIAVCTLSQEVSNNIIVSNIFSYLGRNSLLIFCVHSLDFSYSFLWGNPLWYKAAVYRILFDILIVLLLLGTYKLFQYIKLSYKELLKKDEK